MDNATAQRDLAAPSTNPLLGLLIPRSSAQHPIAEVLLLGARLYAGVTIASAGLDKMPTTDWIIAQVDGLGFPKPEFFAFCACATELFFGILLTLGIATRIGSLLLAFTLGVAAFGFHDEWPIIGMHITQGYFWLFAVFLAIGPGRISFDYLIRNEAPRPRLIGLVLGSAATLAAAGFTLHREFLYTPPPPEPETPVEITGITAPGSFNQWDLSATPLTMGEDGTWSTVLVLEEAGPVSFKLAGNASWELSVGDADQSGARFPIEGVGEPDGGNIEAYIPEPGRYRLEFDLESRRYALSSEPEAGDPR
ncbi:MAG: DoxX family membrane protein [Planctomycetota bacterium]